MKGLFIGILTLLYHAPELTARWLTARLIGLTIAKIWKVVATAGWVAPEKTLNFSVCRFLYMRMSLSTVVCRKHVVDWRLLWFG